MKSPLIFPLILFAGLNTLPAQNTNVLYGINTHQYEDTNSSPQTTQDLNSAVAQTGVTAIRDNIPWATCETTMGTISIPQPFVDYITNAANAHITPVVLLGYGNPLYNGGGYPTAPADVQGFVNYCTAVATKFNGKVAYYQVWNEWENGTGMAPGTPGGATSDYVNLLKAAYPAIKAVNPTNTVIASAIVTSPGDGDPVLKTAIQDGELTACDGVDLHCLTYTGATTDPYATLENWYTKMTNVPSVIVNAGGSASVPIYNTEMCWPSHIGTGGSTQQEQGQFLSRYFFLGSTIPQVKGLFWNELRDENSTSTDPAGNMGVFRNDYTPKTALASMVDTMGFLTNATYAGDSNRIPAGKGDPNVFFLKFKEANGNYFLASWSEWAEDDFQMVLQNATTTNTAVNVTSIGNGTIASAFASNAPNGYTTNAFSLIVRRNPVVIEGPAIQNAYFWQYNKRPWPETIRTVVQETTNVPPNGAGTNGGP